MLNSQALRKLRTALAKLYSSESDARRIAEDAGLDVIHLRFGDTAVNNWHHILSEAGKRDKIDAIIEIVQEEYPANQMLGEAYQVYLEQSNHPGVDALLSDNELVDLRSDDKWLGLLRAIDQHFDEEEVRTLCFELRIDFDNLPARGKVNKVRELITMCRRTGRLPELLELLKRTRPEVSWDFLPD